MSSSKHPWTLKRVAALAAVVIIAAMYILTLVFAIADFDGAGQLFRASLILTVALPILAWLLIWVIGALQGKHTFASPDILATGRPAADQDTASDTGAPSEPVISSETEDSDGK